MGMRMDRRTLAGVMLAGVLAMGSKCTSSPPAGPPAGTHGEGKNGLALDVSKATYAPGEKISITITLTNKSGKPCHILRSPEGAVTIRSLTRDGSAVVPHPSYGSYVGGFNAALVGSLVVVGPGASVSMPWESRPFGSEPLTLETATVEPYDETGFGLWPVGEQGRYELTVGYLVPPMTDAPADVCRIADTATVGFTVGR